MPREKYDWSDLNELYTIKQLSTCEIAKLKGCSRFAVGGALKKLSIKTRSKEEGKRLAFRQNKIAMPSGSNHHFWKGGAYKDRGYIRVLNKNHHRANREGYVLEHIFVWEQYHQKPLPQGWIIHHLNGIKTDNRPENLVATPSKKHSLIIPKLKEKIRRLEIENGQLRRALEDSQAIFYIGEN